MAMRGLSLSKIMKELREKRSLTAKHFDNGDGTFTVQAHSGHIHYNDKVGGTGMRSIDHTLFFDGNKRGWYFNYHSFNPFIPEYSDGWVEFRDLFEKKDQTIKYRAHASHVLGRVVEPSEIGIDSLTQVNCVIYENAFGEGLDYIIYFTRSTMKKVVRIRDGYKSNSDMLFSWDVEFPKLKKVFRTEKKQNIGTELAYELDITKSKVLDTKKKTLIGVDSNDGREWYTYIKDFKCWDSGGIGEHNESSISVLYDAEQKTITKIVPAEFLAISIGDVFSDTTTSYYAGSGDGGAGFERPTSGTWSYVHDTATSAFANNTGTYLQNGGSDGCGVGTGFWSSLGITRSFFPFDTSSIDDGATITSASLFLYITAHYNTGGITAKDYFSVVETNQASTSSISTGDYDECGKSTANGWSSAMSTDIIKLSSDITATSLTDSTYKEFVLNSTGIAAVSKTGYTKLGVRNGYDLENVSQSTSTNTFTFFHTNTSEQTGSANDPYLSVTYTTGSSINSGFFALM